MNILKNSMKYGKGALKKGSPSQAAEGLTALINAHSNNVLVTQAERTKRAQIKADSDIAIKRIDSQKEILQQYLSGIFSERKHMIDGMFDSLNKGIEIGDSDIVASAMSGIVEIAKESPIKQAAQIICDINNDSVEKIEF